MGKRGNNSNVPEIGSQILVGDIDRRGPQRISRANIGYEALNAAQHLFAESRA
jgi:hypothetical protein